MMMMNILVNSRCFICCVPRKSTICNGDGSICDLQPTSQVIDAYKHKNFTLQREAGLPPSTLASSTQQTTIVYNRFPATHSIYNSSWNRWPDNDHTLLMPNQTGGRINTCTYYVFETGISPQGSVRGRILMLQQNQRRQLPNCVP